MRAYAAELKGYKSGTGSIRFPADKPLPAALVTKLVKARIAENKERIQARKLAQRFTHPSEDVHDVVGLGGVTTNRAED